MSEEEKKAMEYKRDTYGYDQALTKSLFQKNLARKIFEGVGGIRTIAFDNYWVLKINNRINKRDSYTKSMHDHGMWQFIKKQL